MFNLFSFHFFFENFEKKYYFSQQKEKIRCLHLQDLQGLVLLNVVELLQQKVYSYLCCLKNNDENGFFWQIFCLFSLSDSPRKRGRTSTKSGILKNSIYKEISIDFDCADWCRRWSECKYGINEWHWRVVGRTNASRCTGGAKRRRQPVSVGWCLTRGVSALRRHVSRLFARFRSNKHVFYYVFVSCGYDTLRKTAASKQNSANLLSWSVDDWTVLRAELRSLKTRLASVYESLPSTEQWNTPVGTSTLILFSLFFRKFWKFRNFIFRKPLDIFNIYCIIHTAIVEKSGRGKAATSSPTTSVNGDDDDKADDFTPVRCRSLFSQHIYSLFFSFKSNSHSFKSYFTFKSHSDRRSTAPNSVCACLCHVNNHSMPAQHWQRNVRGCWPSRRLVNALNW